jgi:hypothetical protein
VAGGVGAVLVLIGVAFTVGVRNDGPGDDDWRPFVDPQTGIGVELPGDVSTEAERLSLPDGQALDVVFHVSQGWDMAWFFAIYRTDGRPFNLSYGLAGAIEAIDGDLLSTTSGTTRGQRHVEGEANFTEDGRDGVIFLRFLLVEDRNVAVLLQAIGPRAERDRVVDSYSRLVGSFAP